MDSTIQLFSVLLTGFILVSAEKYQVLVETGSAPGAGTDANVYLTITDTNGQSQEKQLKKLFVNNFEAGSIDEFILKLKDLGQISKIKIRHDNTGLLPPWLLKKITIVGPIPNKKKYEFPCGCWLKEGELSKELTPSNGQLAAPVGCSGIFSDASHCWQFDEASANVSPDLKGDAKAMLMDGAEIVESNIRERVASTLQKEGSWIDLGSFKGKCLDDPTMCHNGITMIFWAKISDQDLGSPQATFPKYILSSGGQDTKSRGFSVFHLHDKFVLKVLSDTQKWRMEIRDKVPLNKWFSFAFTWRKDRGLTYYINGVKMGVRPQPEDVLLHQNDFSNLRIGKPNSNNDPNQFLKLKFDQLVTWPRVLNDQEVIKAFNEGGGAPTVSNEPIPSINPCSPNPCSNQGACVADKDKPEGYTCKCAAGFAGPLCDIKEDEVTPTVSTNATTLPNPSATTNTTMGSTTAGLATSGPSTGGSSTGGSSTGGSSTAGPTTTGPTSAAPTISGQTTAGSTPQPTTQTPTSNATSATTSQGSSTATGTPTGTPIGTPTSTQPTSPTPTTGPKPDLKQVIKDILRAINLFRLLHKASLVSKSAEINQKASDWAQKLAVEGTEQIDPNSTYGALVCSHLGNDVAKACAVKWYSTIKDYDWAEPKLLVKASPFTQLVWKTSSHVGIGIAEGASSFKRQNIGSGKYFVVVYFEPRQSDLQDIKANILPATGVSEPAPYASCPEGYEKLLQGSRSCFAVRSTPKTWEDAVAECARDNGTLASIECREEADLIVSMLSRNGTSEAWIGMHDRLSEGRYIWVDGSSIPFSEWLPGEPDGNEAENCIVQARGDHAPGWADRNCLDKKAYVCRVPIPGYTTYKITLQVTEPQSQTGGLSMTYLYPGSYSTCPPAVQGTNDVIRNTLIRFFHAKNITVQPVVNTISCIANGTSMVEVILRLGPEVSPDTLQTLKDYVDQNGGVIHLSNGATAKLIAVDIVNPGSSYCPTQCASACPIGCDPTCCSQTTPDIQYVGVEGPPIAQPYPYPAATQFEPQPLYPKHNPWECPVACTHNVNYCPPYCSQKCCKRRIKIHRF